MRVNELFEVSANPDYLRAAERSLGQAIATQRTFGKSPEEKAAARRTELKREKGMQGYGRRHRAANPEMYPKVAPQPASKLRDPSTEYSDDYSVWAKGRRDTMEQGVAEGSEQSPEKEIERLKLRQDAEHGGASLKRQAATQDRIRKLEKQIKDKQGVAEVSDATLTSYLTKLDKDNLKHRMDPTKRSDTKRMKSGPNFVKAFTKLDNRKQGVAEGRTK
jgi:hypothetical protein